MVHSGHGTARLDQVRFGGLAASCGGRGAVRSGLFWFRVVRSVRAVVSGRVESRWVMVGRSWFGALWFGRSGMLGLGTAVMVRRGTVC
jgi:hypothetical protein